MIVLGEQVPDATQALPVQHHPRLVWLCDQGHDWRWANGWLRYGSCCVGGRVWLLLEFDGEEPDLIPDAWLVHRWEVERDGDRVIAYRRFQISDQAPSSSWRQDDPFAWRDADEDLPTPSDEQIMSQGVGADDDQAFEVKS